MKSITGNKALAEEIRGSQAYVFLDANGSKEYGWERSYLFTRPSRILSSRDYDQISSLLEEIDSLSKRYWVAGYLAYEAAYGMDDAFEKLKHRRITGDLAWFGIFDKGPFEVRDIHSHSTPGSPVTIAARLDKKAYARAIGSIHRKIARGETYQVNFTFDNLVETGRTALDLYLHLRSNQNAPFCSLIGTGNAEIVSFSPELLYRRSGSSILVRPMKGTAPRGRYPAEDEAWKEYLRTSAKECAENVMIVDMMRNDIGRICTTGSVRVPSLFKVETHRTLHQMTSIVNGRLRNGTGFHDVIRAVFPSGSVTGAPKIQTMKIIRNMEQGIRDVYCGAIGFISPHGKSIFSVPIRTLRKDAGATKWHYRVGSGIISDATAGAEWRECLLKRSFLVHEEPVFEIFESLLLQNGRYRLLTGHMRRMKKSSEFFGYPFRPDHIRKELSVIRKQSDPKASYKVRVFLDKEGKTRSDFQILGLAKANEESMPEVMLAGETVDSSNTFLFHKTTHRTWYRHGTELVKEMHLFDCIYTNENGLITEGTRSNVFARIGGTLYTPPLECGLLPGVLRDHLLKKKKCLERPLTEKDLVRAQAVYCGNSVRGLIEVQIKTE